MLLKQDSWTLMINDTCAVIVIIFRDRINEFRCAISECV